MAEAVEEILQLADLVRVSDSPILSSSALHFNEDGDLVCSWVGSNGAPKFVEIPVQEVPEARFVPGSPGTLRFCDDDGLFVDVVFLSASPIDVEDIATPPSICFDAKRREGFNRAYEGWEFPQSVVGTDGAVCTPEQMSQAIYLENENGPSTKACFVVGFCTHTHEVEAVYCYDAQSGNALGSPRRQSR